MNPMRSSLAPLLILGGMLLSSTSCQSPPAQSEPAISFVNQYMPLPFGAIKPTGWMAAQMQRDLTHGFVGRLNQLVPDLIIEDDIYGQDRLTKAIKSKDVGAKTDDGGEWEVQFLWWNSETQSNWWDGYVRNALLTDEPEAVANVNAYVDQKLATQDVDGYIGIYAEDLRYDHSTENGELWAQASLFRGLLAYYEATQEPRVLEAVERAVQRTMQAYPIYASEPFNIPKPYAGVGHGLMFTDVLNHLHTITGNRAYIDYAVFLYEDYNRYDLSEVDIQTDNLLNPAYKFKGHGVHTYEHLRTLVLAARYSDKPKYVQALAAYLERLEKVTTPSGGPIGDEWIAERDADSDETGYEYCSIHELLHSYSVLLEKTGDPAWADKIEWLLFNAGQGARHPNGNSIAYCKTDNAHHAMGALHLADAGKDGHNRYKYSPAHKDVAVCCVPNAGRIYPYFVQAMWMQNERGLVATLYGPSRLDTDINGQRVQINQQTNYPFEHTIAFEIKTASPVSFELALRKPSWATGFDLNTEATSREDDSFIYLTKTWAPGDRIAITFETEPMIGNDAQQQRFVSYGPLLFALPLRGTFRTIKTYPVEGFADQYIERVPSKEAEYQWMAGASFEVESHIAEGVSPWETALTLTGTFYDPSTQQNTEAELIPMGGTMLRRISFPVHTTQ